MEPLFPSRTQIEALRSIVQDLESSPVASARQPQVQDLKLQILATIAALELHEQSAPIWNPTLALPSGAYPIAARAASSD